MNAENWRVYLILCENGALYCGISNRPQERFAVHLSGKGAKYTRLNKPAAMRIVSDDLSTLSDTSSDLVFSVLHFISHSSLKFIKKLNAYSLKNPPYCPVANRAMVHLIRLKNINYLVF